MELREFFSEDAIKLNLDATGKDEVLKELISLLKLDEKSEGMLFKMLKRRENLGSTGIGRGIAIPHCRSLVVNKLRVAFGRKSEGLDFKAIDEKPVHFCFLIVAPPLEVSNQYLPVLGKIAQFSKDPDVPGRLLALQEPKEFLTLLGEKAYRFIRCVVSNHLGMLYKRPRFFVLMTAARASHQDEVCDTDAPEKTEARIAPFIVE